MIVADVPDVLDMTLMGKKNLKCMRGNCAFPFGARCGQVILLKSLLQELLSLSQMKGELCVMRTGPERKKYLC